MELIKKVPKSIHKLVETDINPVDCQNFTVMEKIMQDSVFECLRKHVIDSEATIINNISVCVNACTMLLRILV